MSKGIPPWLEPLLRTQFFAACRSHLDSPRNESNMFCLDCNDNNNGSPAPASTAFCFYCHSSRHCDHRVVQIRRSSYHDVVRVGEIQKAIDVGGVQTYVINGARVIFLNERPQPKSSSSSLQDNLNSHNNKGGGGGGASSRHHHYVCEICGRSLLDTFRFCSLGCKLAGVRRNGNASFDLGETTNTHGGEQQHEITERSSSLEARIANQGPPRRGLPRSKPARVTGPNSKRRKGVPSRAPLGS